MSPSVLTLAAASAVAAGAPRPPTPITRTRPRAISSSIVDMGNKKAPLQSGRGAHQRANPYLSPPAKGSVGISTSVPFRTGCCGVAGPGPQPLWIRLCFIVSLKAELTRKARLCQCALRRGRGGAGDVGVGRDRVRELLAVGLGAHVHDVGDQEVHGVVAVERDGG